MADSEDDVVDGVDLTGDEYVVVQSLVRRKYRVEDADGNVVLRAKQKLLRMKEEFPFVDADGEPVFTVKASNVLDVAGDYTLVDETDGEPIAVLRKEFSLLQHRWTVKDPDTDEALAVIESRSALVQALRSLVGVFALLPHRYTIETPDGREIGEIAGRLSIRDTYDVRIVDDRGLAREALVASAIAADALEGN